MGTFFTLVLDQWWKWLAGLVGTVILFCSKKIWGLFKSFAKFIGAKRKTEYLKDINTKIENYHTEVNTKIENYHNELEEFKNISLGADEEHEEQMTKILSAIETLREGILSSHFNMLLNKSMKYVKRGWITVEELELYEEELEVYKNLKGNGHMDAWIAKVRALPNKKIGE